MDNDSSNQYRMRHFIKLEMDTNHIEHATTPVTDDDPGTLCAAACEDQVPMSFLPPYNNGDLPDDIFSEQTPTSGTPAICKEVVYEDEEEYSDDQD